MKKEFFENSETKELLPEILTAFYDLSQKFKSVNRKVPVLLPAAGLLLTGFLLLTDKPLGIFTGIFNAMNIAGQVKVAQTSPNCSTPTQGCQQGCQTARGEVCGVSEICGFIC